jgi:hypothetical protein
VAADQPEDVRIKLATFLKQVPSRIRHSHNGDRPTYPAAQSVPSWS